MFIFGYRDCIHVFIVEVGLLYGVPTSLWVKPNSIDPPGPNSINNNSPSQSSFIWNYSCSTISCVFLQGTISHITPGVCSIVVLNCLIWLICSSNHINEPQYFISNSTMSNSKPNFMSDNYFTLWYHIKTISSLGFRFL